MKLCTLSTGDSLYRYYKTIVLPFEKPRKVLSTSLFRGGYFENLTGVFNHNTDHNGGMCAMENYYDNMRQVAQKTGLDPDAVSGMGTAALMENVDIQKVTYENLTVTAIVTGGVEVNGGRVGDPADHFNPVEKTIFEKPGTINIMLVIDADLPAGVLARALVTCTEAKTAALQELMSGSNYSHGLATGSGTDQTIVIANSESDLYLLSAGKHSKLGELIGRVVKKAVKEALYKQTGLSPKMQHSVLRRLKRFGVNEEKLWQTYAGENSEAVAKPKFIDCLYKLDTHPQLVTYTSLFVHLLDQFSWELLSEEEVRDAENELLALATEKFEIPAVVISGRKLEDFVQSWTELVAGIMKHSCN